MVSRRSLDKGLPKPPTYDGLGQWKSFYLQFKTYCNLKDMSDQQKAKQLCLSLKGKALDFYSCQPETVQDNFHRIVTKLEQRFGKKDLPETLRLQFSLLRQNVDESAEEWADRVQRLALEAFIDLPETFMNSEIIRRFCQGCLDKETAQYAADRCPTTIEEAIRLVKRHVQNSKAIYGSKKAVRQLSCSSCNERYECDDTHHVRSVQHEGTTSEMTITSHDDEEHIIRKIKGPQQSTSRAGSLTKG